MSGTREGEETVRAETGQSARMRFAITIEIAMTDEALLREHALENATQSSEDVEAAQERLQTVQDCIQQVFDPGDSPPGTEIENSAVEVIQVSETASPEVCDECGSHIPVWVNSHLNEFHRESCSLYAVRGTWA